MDLGELTHLLRRTEYVARPERIAALEAGTRAEAVDAVLAFSPTPVAIPPGLDHDIDGQGYQQWVDAVQWWLDRMVDSPTPLQEKLTWFWHAHFCSSWDKVNSSKAMTDQNKLFRDSALGNFRTLVQAMSIQPAMLWYLDNVQNVKTSPNQNFARELMELFTLGVGNYTEADVTAAAQAWTGHGLDDNAAYTFYPGDHDTDQKTFMGVTRNWDGPGIVDYLLSENATTKLISCKFLSKKLWENFAYTSPSQAIVDELAQVLFDNDMAMLPWLKSMFNHDEFYSTTARQGKVKSPVEWVVSVMYWTGLRGADLNPQWYVDNMGQEPFGPPNVAGWKHNAYWTNSSLFGARADFARDVTWRLRDSNANDIAEGRTAVEIADALDAMFGLDLSATTRQAILDYVAVQRANDQWGGWWLSTNLLTMAMMTPEMHLA